MRSSIGHGQAAILVQKGERQMLGLDLGVPALLSRLLSGGERFLGLEREAFQLHRGSSRGAVGWWSDWGPCPAAAVE